MKFLKGWKTILGLGGALLVCAAKTGFSVVGIVACLAGVVTAPTTRGTAVEGAFLGLALLGLADKVARARAGEPFTFNPFRARRSSLP